MTLIINVVQDSLDQGFEVLRDVSIVWSSRNETFDRLKEERDRLPEDVYSYKMEKVKLEKTLLDNVEAMESMMWSLVDLERSVDRLRMEKSLFMEMNKEVFLHSKDSHKQLSYRKQGSENYTAIVFRIFVQFFKKNSEGLSKAFLSSFYLLRSLEKNRIE